MDLNIVLKGLKTAMSNGWNAWLVQDESVSMSTPAFRAFRTTSIVIWLLCSSTTNGDWWAKHHIFHLRALGNG
jgi:hypothetical protein